MVQPGVGERGSKETIQGNRKREDHDLQEGAAELVIIEKSIPGAREQAVRQEGLGRCMPLSSAFTGKQFR